MYKLIKRFFDIIFSLISLLILMPFFALVILILKFTGEGEVFYFQQRIGFRNQSFEIWKFATMIKNSPKLGSGSLTLRNDPRVLPFGKFLRKTKINELPQLINILIGDISFIGPRPQMKVDFEKYPKYIQENIYNSKPGLSGIGSIIFRDEEKLISDPLISDPHKYYKEIIAPYKGALEMWYQRKQSFQIDLKLIIVTLLAVLFSSFNWCNLFFKDLPSKNL